MAIGIVQRLPSLLVSIGGKPQELYLVVQWFRRGMIVVVIMARGGSIGVCGIKVYWSSTALVFVPVSPTPNDVFENGLHCFDVMF